MIKKIFFFLAVFFLNLSIVKASGALSEIVVDQDSGRILYAKGQNDVRLIASTTKIMTALVVINNTDNLSKTVEVGDEVLKAYGSSIYLKIGEKLSIEDLLYGLMLRSGNDAALVLAKNTAGSIEGFVHLMNETAQNIGMKDTTFSNPSGLDEENQNKSTVYDMAILMIEAMKNDTFKKITSTKKYSVKTNFNTHNWANKNKLLTDYKYATGGKIGYTTAAKHAFVSSATKDEKNLIVATFVDSDRFITHKNLYEKYFELYEKYLIVDKNKLNIDYKKNCRLYTMSSYYMLLKKDELKSLKRDITFYNDAEECDKGTLIGNMVISINGLDYKRMNIYADKNNSLPKKKNFLSRIFK